MPDFVMPTLGADMEAGTLVAWKKRPGEYVKRGDIIAEVETDKAVIEVEVFTSGVIERVLVEPGQKVPVGTVMAVIRDEGPVAATAQVEAKVEAGPRPKEQPAPPPWRSTTSIPRAPDGRPRISPAARQLAAELGVEIATLTGTGPDGAVTLDDVRRASSRPLPPTSTLEPRTSSPESAGDRQARMRQAIATAMTRSKREIPHYYLSTPIDMTPALNWLAEENRNRSVTDRLLYGVLLIKAVALALREVPELNAVWKEGQAVPSAAIHVGVAISLRQGGLVAPALHNTDRTTLGELMTRFRDLVQRARAGNLRSSELSDPTITVTSLGEQGVEAVFGVIYPPQVGLVGFGKIVERAWVVAGQVAPRQVLTATLSADHRVTDGHRGGLFLAAVDRLLQEPRKL